MFIVVRKINRESGWGGGVCVVVGVKNEVECLQDGSSTSCLQ